AIRAETEALSQLPAILDVAGDLSTGAPDDSSEDERWHGAHEALASFQKTMWGRLHHVFVTDRDGRVVLSPPKPGTESSHMDQHVERSLITTALGGATSMTPFFGFEEVDHFHPLMVSPIRSRDGQVVGTIVAEIAVPPLLAGLNPESLGARDVRNRLLTREGTEVVHGASEEGSTPSAGAALATSSEAAFTTRTRSAEDDALLARFVRSDTYPWVLETTRPMASVLAPVVTHVGISFAVGGVLFIGTLIAARILANRMTRPLIHFSQRLTTIASGYLGHKPFHGEGRDELGVLARATNDLSEGLGGIVRRNRTLSIELAEAADNVRSRCRELAASTADQMECVLC
ncbi:MAG: methyl-accepting chemotaxis protein, partial [Phycisphaerales bacterium]|nr:methyl-accepting chemotaxis protein [Phycisphaerales bacterium]